MTIKVTVVVGLEFGSTGKPVTEVKTFDNVPDYDRYRSLLAEFDAEDEIVSVAWDCK